MRHRRVPKTYSPDDPTLQDYWRQRGSSPRALANRPRQLASQQQGRRPAFAPAAGPDANGRYGPLDGIAEADVLVGDEPRKGHPVGLTLIFFAVAAACHFVVHGLR